jgi:hypothetical protein
VVFVVIITALLAVAGLFARLAIANADSTSLTNYVTTLLPLLVPVGYSVIASHKASTNSVEGKQAAQAGQVAAEESKAAATEAAANTNGKMDIRFAEIKSMVAKLDGTMTRHLEMHAQVQEGGPNAGNP